MVPPAASIALRADALAASTLTLSAVLSSPPASSLTGPGRRTMRCARSQAASTTACAGAADRRPTLTIWYSTRPGFLKPRFGTRRWSGIWPPSNHAGILPPARAFLPLWPLPAVPPTPVAPPLPRRLGARVAPAAGRMLPMRMRLSLPAHHLDEVADLEDHAPDLGRVLVLDDVTDALETERAHGRQLIGLVPARALELPDADLRHWRAPRGGRTSPPGCGRASPRRPRD